MGQVIRMCLRVRDSLRGNNHQGAFRGEPKEDGVNKMLDWLNINLGPEGFNGAEGMYVKHQSRISGSHVFLNQEGAGSARLCESFADTGQIYCGVFRFKQKNASTFHVGTNSLRTTL